MLKSSASRSILSSCTSASGLKFGNFVSTCNSLVRQNLNVSLLNTQKKDGMYTYSWYTASAFLFTLTCSWSSVGWDRLCRSSTTLLNCISCRVTMTLRWMRHSCSLYVKHDCNDELLEHVSWYSVMAKGINWVVVHSSSSNKIVLLATSIY